MAKNQRSSQAEAYLVHNTQPWKSWVLAPELILSSRFYLSFL